MLFLVRKARRLQENQAKNQMEGPNRQRFQVALRVVSCARFSELLVMTALGSPGGEFVGGAR